MRVKVYKGRGPGNGFSRRAPPPPRAGTKSSAVRALLCRESTCNPLTVTAEAAGSSPVVPAILPKDLARFWKFGAIHKKIHITGRPPTPVSFFRWQNHFHHFTLRPPLCTADRVGVDVHGDVAVGVAHQRLHRLHILIVLSKKCRKGVSTYAIRIASEFRPAAQRAEYNCAILPGPRLVSGHGTFGSQRPSHRSFPLTRPPPGWTILPP